MRRIRYFSFLFLLSCWLHTPAHAEMPDKTSVQAAFLYNFALFVEWPSLPDTEFRMCFLGDAQMFKAAESLKSKQIKDRQVKTLRVNPDANLNSCQILFVGNDETDALPRLTRRLSGQPVLVVAEQDGFDPKDVTITLTEQQGRIAFQINHTAAQANSLTMSSKLLKLALKVY